MPMRHYFYVVNPSDSMWEVRSAQEPTRTFSSKVDALAAARQACQQRASPVYMPCGMRIQHGVGDWVDDQP